MAFLTPLALAFAALSIPILILYMLKLRRRDILVSSTLLWQQLLRDREANAPWQRLRRNLLLFLQLAILALLALALARPFVPVPVVASGSVVLLLDVSASMQARDVAPTRFQAAVRATQDVLDGLSSGDVATLVAVGAQPQVLASATGDRALLRRALEQAEPTNGAADWEAAFTLASASLAGIEDAKVVIVSDGALPPSLPALPGEVRFVGVGGGGDNVAIDALATRDGVAGPQAFLRVVNYGTRDVETLVEFLADAVVFDARRLRVPAGGSADLTLTDLPYDMRVLQASLSVEDALAVDNVAWAVHTPPASGRVLFISPGNVFLERALSALPDVNLVRLSPDQPLPDEAYDLYVYDRVISSTLPAGNLWLIAPPASVGDGLSLRVGGVFSATTITQVASDDALLRYVDWGQVHILQARSVEPPPGARVLVSAQGGPLLFVAQRPEGRMAVQTFDLHDSDLPLQIAFPILVSNLTDWLLPEGAIRFPAAIRPGDAVPIQPHPEATAVHVTAPDGRRRTLRVGQEMPVFAATDQLGLYRVDQDGGEDSLPSAAFAVNLFDAAESDIAPRDVILVGQTELSGEARQEEGRREFWPWLAGVALGVIVVEWWAYVRGSLPWSSSLPFHGRQGHS